MALGGMAATVAYQHYSLLSKELPACARSTCWLWHRDSRKRIVRQKEARSPEENFVEANPKEKVQSAIGKMREQAIEPVLEFKPLDLTRR